MRNDVDTVAATVTAAGTLMVPPRRQIVRLRLDRDTPIDDVDVRRFDDGYGRIAWHRTTGSAADTIRPGYLHHNPEGI